MARPSNKDRVKTWQKRVTAGKKAAERWDERFQVKKLEPYYAGDGQWPEGERDGKYWINLFFPSIETKIPSMLFFRPRLRVAARPQRADDPGSNMDERVKLLEDTGNTFIQDQRFGFMDETSLALKESFYRFGVVEVGYTADFTDNPNAGKPLLNEKGEEQVTSEGTAVLQPDAIPQSEALYIRRIPASQFLVPPSSKNALHQNDWCGYWEWMHVSDVKANPRYKNTDALKASGKLKGDEDKQDGESPEGMVRVFKVWSIREKKRYVFVDSSDKFLIDGEPYSLLPFAVLKFHELLDEFRPVPPTFNWLPMQDELNETREQQKRARQRMNRRYIVREGAFDPEQMGKLETGADGVYAYCNVPLGEAIIPVPDAPLNHAINENVPQTKDDFREESAVSGEMRGINEAETATQANIIQVNANVRDSYARSVVAKWLCDIFALILKTARDRMALPFWILRNVDPTGPGSLLESMRIAANWQAVTAPELGDFEFDVALDIESLSPVTEDTQRTQFMAMLAAATQPQMALLLSASPALLLRFCTLHGFRGQKEMEEIRQAVQLVAMLVMGQPAPPGGKPGATGPGQTPSQADIQGQLGAQMGSAA